jgi:hypothetical protein
MPASAAAGRPSVAPTAGASSQGTTLARQITQKKRELEGVAALDATSAVFARRIQHLCDDIDNAAEAASSTSTQSTLDIFS